MEYTPNFKFPIYTDNDTTSYLTTYNTTMGLIDTAIEEATTTIAKNTTDISALESQSQTTTESLSTLTETVAENSTSISGLKSRADGAEQQISTLQNALATTNENLDSVADVAGKIFKGTLSTGETTLAVTIGEFTDNTLVDVYTNVYGVNPLTIELRKATSGEPNLCVMTFDAQGEDINVAVVTRGGAV